MNQIFYFASVHVVLLIHVEFGFAQTRKLLIGTRTFHIFPTSVNFHEAKYRCEQQGWQVASIRNRNVSLMLEENILQQSLSKPIGCRESYRI